MTEQEKCGNCRYYNGEEGDGEQFCDSKDPDVHEDGYCPFWEKKPEDAEC